MTSSDRSRSRRASSPGSPRGCPAHHRLIRCRHSARHEHARLLRRALRTRSRALMGCSGSSSAQLLDGHRRHGAQGHRSLAAPAHNGYIEPYRKDELAVFQYEPDKSGDVATKVGGFAARSLLTLSFAPTTSSLRATCSKQTATRADGIRVELTPLWISSRARFATAKLIGVLGPIGPSSCSARPSRGCRCRRYSSGRRNICGSRCRPSGEP